MNAGDVSIVDMWDEDDVAVSAIGRLEVVPAILDTVCRATGMGFAAIARVTDTRWIACAVHDEISFGLRPGGELSLESTICDEIRRHNRPVIISDVASDQEFCDHDTPARYGFRSYISFPIFLRDGRFFGTLCAIDPAPADLARPEIANMFKMFAELIAFHLSAQQRVETAETKLSSEQASSTLREQFIAVLGHDLRNPLASVQAGMTLLKKEQTRERTDQIFGLMQSSINRMAGLIDDILDFARGRLGGGIRLQSKAADVNSIISQVVAELVTNHPDHEVVTRLNATRLVACDAERISQLVSNLVGNALTHGAKDRPVEVVCATTANALTIAVANGGDQIPPEKMEQLFHPFAQGDTGSSRHGLGLGLFIASEIAKAHDGELSVSSKAEATVFSFTMPLAHAIAL